MERACPRKGRIRQHQCRISLLCASAHRLLIQLRKAHGLPACPATGRPSRYTSRLLASAGTFAPGSRVPARFSGSTPQTAIKLPSGAGAELPRSNGIASGNANCSPAKPTDKAPATNLAARFKPMEGAQQLPPARQPIGLTFQQSPEHHTVAAQQGHGDVFQGVSGCWRRSRVIHNRRGQSGRRNSAQRPASSMPPTKAPRPRRLLRCWRLLAGVISARRSAKLSAFTSPAPTSSCRAISSSVRSRWAS